MVDALDSKSGIRKGVRVRVPSPAMKETQLKGRVSFFFTEIKKDMPAKDMSPNCLKTTLSGFGQDKYHSGKQEDLIIGTHTLHPFQPKT